MATYRKRMPNGNLSPTYYYEFEADGRRYRGSTGCTTKKEAERFERDRISVLRQASSVDALARARREAITGGAGVLVAEAFGAFLAKPRRRPLSDHNRQVKALVWVDFAAFVHDRHPTVTAMADVSQTMAEEYLQHVRTTGRYTRGVSFKRKGRRKAVAYTRKVKGTLSNRTCIEYQAVLTEVFDRLGQDAGLAANPFRAVPRVQRDTESRDAFTLSELQTVHDKADPFVRSLFMVGLHTGLREGDICTLRWSEVDLPAGLIVRRMLKTGKTVRVPILAGLRTWLGGQPRTGEYVLPDHAGMYLANPTGVSYRVKSFLEREDVGIATTRKAGERGRAVSVKDVHSLRHTFVYLAAAAGVPFPVVKAIVGHVDPRMTEHYANHATDELSRSAMAAMPALFGALPVAPDLSALRARAHAAVDSADADVLARVLAAVEG